MTAPSAPDDTEADVFRQFALACRIERDRLSLAEIAEQDRRVDREAVDRALAEAFANRLITLVCGARATRTERP
jgi:hypothetical protein